MRSLSLTLLFCLFGCLLPVTAGSDDLVTMRACEWSVNEAGYTGSLAVIDAIIRKFESDPSSAKYTRGALLTALQAAREGVLEQRDAKMKSLGGPGVLQ